jgi:hypothetical protein
LVRGSEHPPPIWILIVDRVRRADGCVNNASAMAATEELPTKRFGLMQQINLYG